MIPKRIYRHPTAGILMALIWGGIVVIGLVGAAAWDWADKQETFPALELVGIIVLPSLVLAGLIARQIALLAHVRRLLARRQYHGSAGSYSKTLIGRSAVAAELDELGSTHLIAESAGGKLYDAIFYQRTATQATVYDPEAGRAVKSYYTVFEAQLSRPAPHLVFDSTRAKKRQFGRLYTKAQRLEPDAALVGRFEVWAPKHYQLDTLSFITPEVSQAMLALADEADIELLDDRLLAYAPLIEGDRLAAFSTHCQALRQRIDNNLASYRDSWETGTKSRQAVADFGRQLLDNPRRYWLLSVWVGLLLVCLLLFAILGGRQLLIMISPLLLFVLGVLVWLLWQALAAGRRNRRREAVFLSRFGDD